MDPPALDVKTPRQKRSIIYIDGFNLYYGALSGGPHKWLDLEKYFHLLLPNDDIQKIRYFTAKIVGSHASNQDAYLSALATLPLVDIILGRFKRKQIQGNCVVRASGSQIDVYACRGISQRA